MIKKTDRKPCGCTLTEYDNGRKLFAPCIPCGLMRAGHALARAGTWWHRRQALREAGNALAAVATTINRAADHAQREQDMAKTIDTVLENES